MHPSLFRVVRKQHAAERRSAELTCRLSLAFHGVTLALLALGAIVGLLKAEGPWFSTVPSTMLAFWLSVSALIIVCLSATTVRFLVLIDATILCFFFVLSRYSSPALSRVQIQHRYIAALNATHAVLEELAQSIERYDDAFQRGVRFLQELEMVARGYHLYEHA